MQASLRAENLSLKVYDCYRPQRAVLSFVAWAREKDAAPATRRFFPKFRKDQLVPLGYIAEQSSHPRGVAVDLTLVDAQGQELVMPTPFDDFGEKAHRSYQQLPPLAIQNRTTLEQAMAKAGFVGMPTEWWHFDFARWQGYPLDDIPFDVLAEPPKKSAQP